MTMPTVGQKAPEFSLPDQDGVTHTLLSYKGKWVLLYFYPKDSTPGCTTEAIEFRDLTQAFESCNAIIVGVSRDSIASHERFKEKLALPFELISDQEEALCQLFGTIKMKNRYGKQVRGIERSTFLIDDTGTLVKEWRGVKVPGHVADVLATLRTLT